MGFFFLYPSIRAPLENLSSFNIFDFDCVLSSKLTTQKSKITYFNERGFVNIFYI